MIENPTDPFKQPFNQRVSVLLIRRVVYNQFFIKTLINTFISLSVIILIYLLLKNFLPSLTMNIFGVMSENPFLMFAMLFFSESFFGLLPPDFFIMWALECPDCILYLATLSILSYFGGIVSFNIGKLIRRYPLIKEFLHNKLATSSDKIDKWGGLVVMLAALTPIPFSPVSALAGSLNYSSKKYAIFSSVRIIRFFVYALIFWLLA